MRVTVLGSSASYAGPGQACAGHLVEGADSSVLFDCGNGVLANLGRVLDPLKLDAVVISHYHPDHLVDLFSMQALLRYAPEGPAPRMRVFAPSGVSERMKCLLSDRGASEFDEAFEFVDLEDGVTLPVDGLRITAVSVEHTEPTFAFRVEGDGALLCYTADTAPGEGMRAAIAGADLLLCEATLPEGYAGLAPHLTAWQAGEEARAGNVGELVLVHVWPSNDRDEMARLASEAFGRPVSVAREMDTYEVRQENR